MSAHLRIGSGLLRWIGIPLKHLHDFIKLVKRQSMHIISTQTLVSFRLPDLNNASKGPKTLLLITYLRTLRSVDLRYSIPRCAAVGSESGVVQHESSTNYSRTFPIINDQATHSKVRQVSNLQCTQFGLPRLRVDSSRRINADCN